MRKQLAGNAPLILRTSDGKEFRVPHPKVVLVGQHNLVIEDEEGMLEIIDPLHVVSIRPSGAQVRGPCLPRNGVVRKGVDWAGRPIRQAGGLRSLLSNVASRLRRLYQAKEPAGTERRHDEGRGGDDILPVGWQQ